MSYFPQLYSNFQFDEFKDIPITVWEWAHENHVEGGKPFLNLWQHPTFPIELIQFLLGFLEQNGQYENLDQDTSSVASDAISDCIVPSPLIDIPGSTLGLGSLVEVDVDSEKTLHGVIRWIGQKTNQELGASSLMKSTMELVVGVELDEPVDRRLKLNLSDGVYNGQRCFRCPDKRAIFVAPKRCTKDRRFPDDPSESKASGSVRSNESSDGRAFGGADCPIIEGSVPALSKFRSLQYCF